MTPAPARRSPGDSVIAADTTTQARPDEIVDEVARAHSPGGGASLDGVVVSASV